MLFRCWREYLELMMWSMTRRNNNLHTKRSYFVLFARYYYDDKIKEDEMSGACNTYGINKYIQNFNGSCKGPRYRWENNTKLHLKGTRCHVVICTCIYFVPETNRDCDEQYYKHWCSINDVVFIRMNFMDLTLWRRSLSNSKCYLRIQSVPQREHHTSSLQRSTG
jgi:hypothetical protein